MANSVPYSVLVPQLVEQVEQLQNRLDEAENLYIRIRREPAASAPTSLEAGGAVMTSTGLYFNPAGSIVSATLS